MCVVVTFRYSRKKTGHLTLVSPEMRKNHSKNVQFFNSITPRLQSTDVINILLSLLLSKRVAWRRPTTDLRYAGNFVCSTAVVLRLCIFCWQHSILLMCTTKLLSDHCFPTSSKAITSLVKRCCDVLVCSFERDDLEQVNVLKRHSLVPQQKCSLAKVLQVRQNEIV